MPYKTGTRTGRKAGDDYSSTNKYTHFVVNEQVFIALFHIV